MSGISPKHIAFSPLNKNQWIAVFLSTLFSIASLTPVIEPKSFQFPVMLVFLGLTFAPRRIWTPLTRFILFVTFAAAIFLGAGGLSGEVGTVILIATMLIKYVEMRNHRDASMMALFNIIAPFIAFLQDQTPLILLFAFLSLLSTISLIQILNKKNDRDFWSTIRKSVGMFFRTSLKIVPVALVIYALLPRVDSPFWGSYMRKTASGMSEEMNVDQWSEVFEDFSTAFRVRFEGKTPPVRDLYFRGITLWTFDGKKWVAKPSVPNTVKSTLKLRGSRQSEGYTYTVSYEQKGKRFYVLDYPSLVPPGAYRMSDDVFFPARGRQVTGQGKWTSSLQTPSQLTPEEEISALQLPAGNPRIQAWSKEERKKFKSDLDFAQHIEKYLRGNFEYTLSPPPVGENVVDDFFFGNKKGFCIHFSSAFTVIMRSAGIPSRAVQGYVASELSETGDYYRVREADAHAWSEIWVDGKWIRFDPTASVGALNSTQGFGWSFLKKSYATLDWVKDRWEKYVIYYDKSAQEQTVNKIKNAFTLNGLKTMVQTLQKNSLFVVLLTLGGACLLFWRRRRRKDMSSDKIARMYHLWLLDRGQPNEAESFFVRTKKVASALPDNVDRTDFWSSVNVVFDYLYNPQTTLSYSSAKKTIRKLKNTK